MDAGGGYAFIAVPAEAGAGGGRRVLAEVRGWHSAGYLQVAQAEGEVVVEEVRTDVSGDCWWVGQAVEPVVVAQAAVVGRWVGWFGWVTW